MRAVLVVSSRNETFQAVRAGLGAEYRVGNASSTDHALALIREKSIDFVLIDLERLGRPTENKGYRPAMDPFWRLSPAVEIIVMSSAEMIREAVKAVREGASDYLTYPLKSAEIEHVLQTASEDKLVRSELDYLRDRFWHEDVLEIVQTKSEAMLEVFSKIRSVAPTRSTVLLTGETGTGKSLLARLIHQHSNRKNDPFVSVHCGAIPDTLVESELFGHEKGAFTGAIRKKLGKFEIAHQGTMFLDEIGTITPSAQIKLLLVLQDGTFQRVGGEDTIQVNVRVIAASNMDLKAMCDEGLFRKDLFYRLNVFPIEIPPLRDRPEDISRLVQFFLSNLNRFEGKEIQGVDPLVIEAFQAYDWPGNIREMENLMERAYILETGTTLKPAGFPVELFQKSGAEHLSVQPDVTLPLAQVRRKGIEAIEELYLRELLSRNKGKIGVSAKSAGITTRQFSKLIHKYGIRKETYK